MLLAYLVQAIPFHYVKSTAWMCAYLYSIPSLHSFLSLYTYVCTTILSCFNNASRYVAVHATSTQASSDGSSSSSATHVSLQQSYMPVEVHEKLDALYSFIKAHLKAKTVVFLATCSQVRAWMRV